jgi:zinc transporter ZupT
VNAAALRIMTVWACITGLALVGLAAIEMVTGHRLPDAMQMLLGAVVGFELYLFGRELWHKARRHDPKGGGRG